jgi:hypothetical protein
MVQHPSRKVDSHSVSQEIPTAPPTPVEPDHLLPWSQEPASKPYLELVQSIIHSHTLLL